jgi:glyoxylase-like metal-dependent hydrolase (beta-lactamase superfamily II)
MPNFICITCGTQFAETAESPERCPICDDERQYVGENGQRWTTLDVLQETHRNLIRPVEAGLLGIRTDPIFAIGERALLIQSPDGNVLWDCISLLDDATISAVRALGGIKAIAISHPHFYTTLVEWSRAFDAPVYLNAADREWVQRPDPAIVFWDGPTHALGDGLTLIRCGGHFPGSSVLHWAGGADGRGALLTADTIYVTQDHRFVTFMYSYPNLIPLPAATIEQIVGAVEPFAFERVYSGWPDRVVQQDGKAAVRRSAERYIRAIKGQ